MPNAYITQDVTSVHLHQFAIHQPQTLHYSTVVTINPCPVNVENVVSS